MVRNMSVDKLEEQKEALLDEREALEEKCDTLPECELDDGCNKCKTSAKITTTPGYGHHYGYGHIYWGY